MAAPAPRAVIMFPSVTDGSLTTSAPSKKHSNPSKQVAFFPESNPRLPKIDGAAQMAPISAPFSAAFSIKRETTSLLSKFKVPGIPPGKITASISSGSPTSLSVTSAPTAIPCEPTMASPPTPTTVTSSSARRRISIGAIASISSNPPARKQYIIT